MKATLFITRGGWKNKIGFFIIVSLLLSLGFHAVSAQTTYNLDWYSATYPYPPLTFSTSFNNVSSSGVDLTFNVTGNTSRITELVDTNKYIGNQTGAYESFVNRVDLNNRSESITITVQFSKPVTNVNFVIHDIDRQSYLDRWYRYNYNYLDRLQFSGLSADGSTVVYPQFSNTGKCVAISGNSVNGSSGAESDADCQAGNNTTTNYGDVTVTYPQEITSFTYIYGNLVDGIRMDYDTVSQVVSLDNIYFDSVWDYGDMPNSFNTIGINGARHRTSPGQTLYLGTVAPDDEFDGHPTISADGDNASGVDEEAFSSLPNINATMTEYALDVPLVNTSGSDATLYGWIDFNDDGVFTTSEMVSAVVANGVSTARLTWTGFTLLVPNSTYLRLRLTSNASAINMETSAGSAPDGEVEDYVLEVGSATPVTLLSFAARPEKNAMAAFSWIFIGLISVVLLPYKRLKNKLTTL